MLTPASPRDGRDALRLSLVVTWLATAVVSAWEWKGPSTGVLRDAGIHDAMVIACVVGLGIGVDVWVGLAMWFRPGRLTYRVALVQVALMSIVATALAPASWLHPFGPLLKNLPIAAILWFLQRARP